MDSLPIDPEAGRFFYDEFGTKGAEWLDRVPSLFVKLSKEWDIELIQPILGGWVSLVYKVRYRDRNAVLKLAFPNWEFRSEVKALLVYEGLGAVQVLRYDIDAVAILMPLIEPGRSLQHEPDDFSVPVAIDAMKQLRNASFDPSNYPNLDRWYQELFGDKIANSWVPPDLVHLARETVDDLLLTTERKVLLHADLHYQNILLGQDGWTVIDPKGVVGDPAFEPSAFMRNPLGLSKTSKDLKADLRRRIDGFSEGLGYDPYRVWGWAYSQTLLSAHWANDPDLRADWFAVAVALSELKPN